MLGKFLPIYLLYISILCGQSLPDNLGVARRTICVSSISEFGGGRLAIVSGNGLKRGAVPKSPTCHFECKDCFPSPHICVSTVICQSGFRHQGLLHGNLSASQRFRKVKYNLLFSWLCLILHIFFIYFFWDRKHLSIVESRRSNFNLFQDASTSNLQMRIKFAHLEYCNANK